LSVSPAADARIGRRRVVLPVCVALVMMGAACAGPPDTADEEAGTSAISAADPAGEELPAPAPLPPPGTPWTAQDSARAVYEDSLYELRNLRTRQAAMDSYEGCMAMARRADPSQRARLEAACGRGRGVPESPSP
jgi:hypothetical protein